MYNFISIIPYPIKYKMVLLNFTFIPINLVSLKKKTSLKLNVNKSIFYFDNGLVYHFYT